MTAIQLSNMDAKLAYLAIQYHLARPGSELHAEAGQTPEEGLAGVARAMEPQLAQAVATIELSEYQSRRLTSAVAGTVNELKSYPLLASGGKSTVPGFTAKLIELFPEVGEEPEEAVQLAGHLVSLRRRLSSVAQQPESSAEAGERAWWRFWEKR